MKLSDLLTDPSTGRMSESKLWLHIAKPAFIWGYVYMTMHDKMDWMLALTFGLLLMAHESISRLIGLRIAGAGAIADARTGP